MRTAYQNKLFRAIQDADLYNANFSRKEENGFYTVSYNHGEELFYFSIKVNEKPKTTTDVFGGGLAAIAALQIPLFSVEMSPGQVASRMHQDYFKWDTLFADFKEWLSWVADEINTPDLWDEAAKTAQLFAPAAAPADDKFTRAELAHVQGQLRQLQQSFAASALPEAAKQALIEITVNISIAAETKTKRDWLGILVGSFTGAVFSLALNPTQVSEVVRLVKAAFGGLFLL